MSIVLVTLHVVHKILVHLKGPTIKFLNDLHESQEYFIVPNTFSYNLPQLFYVANCDWVSITIT